jgi:hypothetical protein
MRKAIMFVSGMKTKFGGRPYDYVTINILSSQMNRYHSDHLTQNKQTVGTRVFEHANAVRGTSD